MRGRPLISRLLGAVLALGWLPVTAQGKLLHVDDPNPALASGARVIDVRPAEVCRERSIAAARCLPAAAFLGPHRRLAGYRDILWLLGTVGLTGSETVLVVGDSPALRDFAAGLLYIAGQAEVRILRRQISQPDAIPAGVAGSGTVRNTTREVVFEAAMRDHLIILGHELAAMLERGDPAVLVDGRSEQEYWGARVRGVRGGHVAGAQSLPASSLRGGSLSLQAPVAAELVAYAHDAAEGLAYFALLHSAGLAARVYPAGWAEWSAMSQRPVDAATYPDQRGFGGRPAAVRDKERSTAWRQWLLPGIAGLLLGVVLVLTGFGMRRRGAA